MKIVENGRALCGIVLPQNPTPREKFASQEVIDYVEKICGVRLPVSDACTNKIIIGGPERNKEAEKVISRKEFEKLVPGPEGLLIDIGEEHILLAGSTTHPGEQERGTLYSVYEFLERFLGCSLAVYSKTGLKAGEYVPRQKEITLQNERFIKKCADVGYRTAIMQYGPWVGKPDHELNGQFISWLAKNRFNRILTWSSVYEGFKKNGMLEEAMKRGIRFSVGHHEAITLLLPHNGNEYFPEAYAVTHPEYYKLLEDGTRHVVKDGDYSGQLILCMRNEELIRQMAENILAWSEKNPQVDIILLWPYDGKHPQCCCEACRAHSKSANYSYFANKIANLVWKRNPQIRLDRISYLDITECDGMPLSSSMVVNKAVWHENLRAIGKPDGSGLENSEFERNILEWKKAGVDVVYYDYLMGVYACRQKWMPAADEMQAICKRFCEKGIWGLGTQLEVYHIWNHVFNFYTYGRTAYDTSLSMDTLLEQFSRIFGAGASMIKEVIRMGEATLDGQVDISQAGTYVIEHIDKEKVYNLYERALAAAEDVWSRNNIRLMRMVFRYSDLEVARQRFMERKRKDEKDESWKSLWATTVESGELLFMRQHFDSYLSGKEGYGISIATEEPSEVTFEPNQWYFFE